MAISPDSRSMAAQRGPTYAFVLAVSAFLAGMFVLGAGTASLGFVSFCLVVCASMTACGEMALRIFRVDRVKARLPMAFVVGFVALSLPMTGLTYVFEVAAFNAFCACAVLVGGLAFAASRRLPTTPPNPGDWTDATVTFLVAAVVALLIKVPASSTSTLMGTGVFPIWTDYFLHGITLDSFGGPFSSGSDMELVGVRRSFYHYAPFVIPAAFQAVSGMPGVAVATSLLLPLGVLIAALGTYVFGAELAGRAGGLLALAVTMCVPVFWLFFQSGWFDFYWMLLVTPGAGYAIGVSMVACVAMRSYLERQDAWRLVFMVLLLCSIILVRAHMFILLAPALTAVVLAHRWRLSGRWVLKAVLAIALTGILALLVVPSAYMAWLEFARPYEYLSYALSWSPIYGHIPEWSQVPFGFAALVETVAVLVAVLGAYALAFPFVWRARVRSHGFRSDDAFPLLLLLSFVCLMLFAPAARNGDLTEYKHRHFPLLYVLVSVYTLCCAFQMAARRMPDHSRLRRWSSSVVVLVFAAGVGLNWGSNPARPNTVSMPWAGALHGHTVIPGLMDVAHYLRAHSVRGDVLSMAASSSTSDPAMLVVQLVSLSGVPAYLSRASLRLAGPPCVRDIVRQRLGVMARLPSIETWAGAQGALRQNGIRWFVAQPGEVLAWDAGRQRAVYSIQGISVYDAGHAVRGKLVPSQC